jgi:putative hemolysin
VGALLLLIRMRYYLISMRILVRYLLWMLIAAIPLQGGAVAFMSCSGSPVSHAPVSYMMVDRMDTMDVASDPQREHCEQAGNHKEKVTHSKCSSCASCCVGAVAPPSVPTSQVPHLLVNFSHASPELAMTVFFPAALERPPRRHS